MTAGLTENQLYGKISAMKTTLDLPDELMCGMKVRAVAHGRKLKDFIADPIRDSLVSKSPAKAPKVVIPTNGGLPHFECDSPSKASPSHEELQKVIEQSQLEEDLQRAGIAF